MSNVSKKENTRNLLLESLRKCMLKVPFSNITIKKICDESNVVRVTFYNYFIDKCDALDAIIYKDFIEEFDSEKSSDLLEHIITVIGEHYDFYKVASEIQGQNGFDEICLMHIGNGIQKILHENRKENSYEAELSNEFLAKVYATNILFAIKEWVHSNRLVSKENFLKQFEILRSHVVTDFIKAKSL